ncbi:hypothetical protein FB565_001808 [Actinoplanes lutulentus]|uniref:Phospholipase D-like protein n=1 Tax=Actinoplanes lutulentus TaxID=1287878 RepID=A0A327Z2A4_9ACTN|nr:PLD nuclease N-terminal domain-containing protein [Actinoplanes lutulentus]MBB2942095.1 hypothetical protein [Actinoplanes lutulentus]RAK26951.1 phospholipase D-like protein [Actinoplanes lutulentus]
MVRLFILLAAVALVLLILALISGLSAERVRNLPRAAWLLVILFIPIAGPAAYFAWGRPVSGPRRSPSRPSSPDDDPDFLRSMNVEKSRREREMLAAWEAELNQEREREADREVPQENEQPDGEQKDEKKP